MSNKVFVEYKVKASHRELMMEFLSKLIQEQPQVKIYEGTDQPGLIVEEWEGMDNEQYKKMKLERLQADHSKWTQMQDWVEGGKEKVHIWQFQSLDL